MFFALIFFFVLSLDFGQSATNPNPTLVVGNGDGTVNERSLLGCAHWKDTPTQGNHKIFVQALPNVEHYNTLSDHRAINYILNQLVGTDNYQKVNKPQSKFNLMKIRIF